MLRYLLLKIIFFELNFKSSSLLIFLHVQLFVISILYFLNLICNYNYVFNLKIFVCSNSCFKFFKLCIAPCNAVNSDCILKVSYFQFLVFLQIHPLTGKTMNSKLFSMHSASLRFVSCIIQISHSLYHQRVGVFVKKPLTSSN